MAIGQLRLPTQTQLQYQSIEALVAGDSMLNNIHERGLSKQYTVKVKNFPGATTEIILETLEKLLQSKPDMLIVHVGTNDLPRI